ncbi:MULTISPECIES: hypothetical protein [unclassified Clostridium]|uniref:hypothetical protein n=1 Tax=unclassified Clostridium TaxID=2614128 RepID=UPI000297AE4B|nr:MULTISPECIES: hypothetical protein [unclassified Clostridium]EKQ58017.1 MAG: hypothetical protein A370_00315 [Clostridium sp. Maddingley MBC34-26]
MRKFQLLLYIQNLIGHINRNYFNDNFKERLERQALTLFISEAIQLQDVAVSKLDILISEEIYMSRNKNIKSNIDLTH